MITLLAFLVTLGVLIVVHEWGHYRVARACGVKVLRFSVGFGRVVLRRQRTPEDTEFVVSALPLGGYVRMLDEREGPVAPHERHQAFNNKPLAQRAAIVAAGPAANLILAVLLYAAVQWIGVDEPRAVLAAPEVGSVAERAGMQSGDVVTAHSSDGSTWQQVYSLNDLRVRVVEAALLRERLYLMATDRLGRGSRVMTLDLDRLAAREVDDELMKQIGLGRPFSEPVAVSVEPGPAADAGLRAGDRILLIDGRPVPDSATMIDRIRASLRDGKVSPVVMVVERAGERLEFMVTPRLDRVGDTPVPRIAVALPPPDAVKVQHGPVDGFVQGAKQTWNTAAVMVKLLGRMVIGEVSVKNLSGPITIADVAGKSAERGLTYYLGFLALVSVSLGVLNLLPLPMLDGGHLMYYIFEAVTGRPVSDWWLKWLQRGGALILLLLMSLALSNDVARLLGLH